MTFKLLLELQKSLSVWPFCVFTSSLFCTPLRFGLYKYHLWIRLQLVSIYTKTALMALAERKKTKASKGASRFSSILVFIKVLGVVIWIFIWAEFLSKWFDTNLILRFSETEQTVCFQAKQNVTGVTVIRFKSGRVLCLGA